MPSNSNKGVWIIGAGHFGRLAVDRLSHLYPPDKMLVIDADEEALAPLPSTGIRIQQAEGVDFLIQHFRLKGGPDWIIPAVPIHLVYRWLLARLGKSGRPVPVPPWVSEFLPNPWSAEGGGYYISLADDICPDDCPEPSAICTRTRLPRKGILYRNLEALTLAGWSMKIMRSRQLAPGVGGLRTKDLWDFQSEIQMTTGQIIVATACKCHGVLHGLEIHTR
jgi:hypothetical protein